MYVRSIVCSSNGALEGRRASLPDRKEDHISHTLASCALLLINEKYIISCRAAISLVEMYAEGIIKRKKRYRISNLDWSIYRLYSIYS